jgi:hypothetical protein
MSAGPSGSLGRTSIPSEGIPNTPATMSANIVSCPWPDGPDRTCRIGLPESPNLIAACSSGVPPPPQGSMNMAKPMPRSLPCFSDSFRRFSNSFQPP